MAVTCGCKATLTQLLAAADAQGHQRVTTLPFQASTAAASRLQLAVELEHAQAGAHAAQLAHKLGKLLDAVRLVRQQVALCMGSTKECLRKP